MGAPPSKPPPPAAGDLDATMRALGASPSGLTGEEAERRLREHGPNALPEHRTPPLLKFIKRFWGPIPWMIEVAAILSAVVGDWADFGIIGTLLMFNGLLEHFQESRADRAVAELKAQLARSAMVRRDGTWRSIPTDQLVPGDVVRLRLGNIVPADVLLIDEGPLELDQSALTGESLPVERTAGGQGYSASIVRRGEGDALVTATGAETFFGRTAALVERAQPVSHYQRAVLRIGHVLIFGTLALVIVVLVVGLFRREPIVDLLRFSLVLTVASIPVAMPAVLAVTMAAGAHRLARLKAIVTRLASIEELAGMDVLCSDKTGTLTQNRLSVEAPICFGDASAPEVLRAAAWASRAEDADPIDTAVLAAAGSQVDTQTVKFTPFDPVTKRTEATVRTDGRAVRVTKGAPQAIVELAHPDQSVRAGVQSAVDDMASRGMRALGVASASDGDAWRLLGLLPIFDPPREDSAETIKELMGGGVDVKMVTGDHAAIAAEIARRLGLGDRIVPADEAFHDHRPIDAAAIDAADGFAQVFPEHKFAIVEALQHAGHIVGMTGDGVNDAPALKHADVGIAVEGSTDAARAAADLVLTAPGLGVIARAIGESRCIFERMTAYATYRIAETTRVLLFLTASILIFRTYPVSAIMIVMLALLNDGPIMMVATDRAREADRPVRWSMGQVISIAAILGCVGVLFSFLLLWIGRVVLALPAPEVQTLLFLKLAVGGHMTLYTARTGPDHFWRRPWPSPVLFWTVECTQVAATLVAIAGILMAAIPWWLALGVWGYGFAAFVVGDAVKVWGWRALRGRAAWGRSLIVLLNSPIHMAHATEVRERRGATRRDRESR